MKKEENIRYIHEETIHNFEAANEMVPFIIKLLEPKSVVDVGCGIGTWLKVFQDNGVQDVLGIDGNYVEKKLLKIDQSKFLAFDLENHYISEKKYDLTISFEVAEHLSIESADNFVKTLTNLSDVVLFSAAIPNQGGQNHINEQEPQYWINKFKTEGYQLFDVIRPFFWDNTKVDPWYRQNTLLFIKKFDVEKINKMPSFEGRNLIQPYFLALKQNGYKLSQKRIENIENGNKTLKYYLKLLFKKIMKGLRRN